MDGREAVGALFKHTRLYTHMEDDDAMSTTAAICEAVFCVGHLINIQIGAELKTTTNSDFASRTFSRPPRELLLLHML